MLLALITLVAITGCEEGHCRYQFGIGGYNEKGTPAVFWEGEIGYAYALSGYWEFRYKEEKLETGEQLIGRYVRRCKRHDSKIMEIIGGVSPTEWNRLVMAPAIWPEGLSVLESREWRRAYDRLRTTKDVGTIKRGLASKSVHVRTCCEALMKDIEKGQFVQVGEEWIAPVCEERREDQEA